MTTQVPLRVSRRRRKRPSSSNADIPINPQVKKARRHESDDQCSFCTRMFSDEGLADLNSPGGFRHRTREDCRSSGETGCSMCKFIFETMCVHEIQLWSDDNCIVLFNSTHNGPRNEVSSSSVPGIWELRICLQSEPQKILLTIYPFAKKENPMEAIVSRRPLRRDVTSDRVFAAAKALINDCMHFDDSHSHCRYSREKVLPSRVLDVGQPGDSQPHIKLRINDTEVYEPYVALSYCWGQRPNPLLPGQSISLEKGKLQDLIKEIRLEELSKSIQDAVRVCRELGFRYLWVDVLCIIQDCTIDKEKEISQMAAIYKNATVTIVAATSSNAADGFLTDAIRPYLPDRKFSIPMSNEQAGEVYLSTGCYEPKHTIDERGWALQEFMLSPRMLIFSEYELLWQCQQVQLQSVTGLGLDYLQYLDSLPWMAFGDDEAASYGSVEADKLYLWTSVVEQYTRRKLTDPEDRLPAITGVISELEVVWGDMNIYGLWKKWFIGLLVWYKPRSQRAEKRFLRRAPSWSWASLDGEISHEGPLTSEDARVRLITQSAAELIGRKLRDEKICDSKLETIEELPDLENACPDARSKEAEYVLLGTVKESEKNSETGVGLLVEDVGHRVYRRLGLARFSDMSIWKDIEPKVIRLEPKL